MTADCPMCGHPNEPIGVLGWLHHFTCRDCGWRYSRKIRKEVA